MEDKDFKKKTIEDLNQCYNDAENCDKEVFSEMRTNVQLSAGDHYNRPGSRYWNRLRESRSVSQDQKIRLTKNHIGRICKIYQNSILSNNPSVTISPKQEKEIQHQKAAEMYNSVLDHIRTKHDLHRKIHLWVRDYVEIGEVATKVFWDPNAGVQVGWAQATDEFGFPIMDPMGQPVQSDVPVMSGDLIFEVIHGFDLLRDPAVKSMEESPYIIVRKMESTKELKKKFGDNPDVEKMIKESSQDTFRVYQNYSSTYSTTKGMTMVREHYYRPCAEYPSGYYFITTESGILAENALPFGIFPIITCAFDEVTTTPRGKSIIKQLRPYQVEINRASSKVAEHQVTLGDDKIVFTAGGKPSTGATQPGIRFYNVSAPGAAPTVIPGRAGDQYIPYIDSQIKEMYQVAEVFELDQEINGQLDPYTLLFRSIRQKQRFSFYGDKFERYLVKVHETAFKLFKKYASPHLLIPVMGKNEQVNILEFKNTPDTMTQIKVEPMGDDVETKLGKQITLNHVLQYLGSKLDKQDIGKFLRLSPYLNMEKMFEDLTLDYDNSVNDILALDRGEFPPSQKHEDHEYALKMVITRMKQPDFRFLHPYIQSLYEQKKQEHEKLLSEQQQEIMRAQSQFIPSGGFAVAADFYVPDPKNPQSTKRVRVPSEALQWLLKQLEIQGSSQEALKQMEDKQSLSEIARMLSPGSQVPSQVPMQEGIYRGTIQ